MTAGRPAGDLSPTALDPASTYQAIHRSIVGFDLTFDVVSVRGEEALSYLQGQVSQDLDGLREGEAREALLLSPQGKLDAYCRVVRASDEEALLVVDRGFGEPVFERLRRFKVRVKADLEAWSWPAVRLAGPEAGHADLSAPIDIAFSYPGLAGRDLIGPQVSLGQIAPRGDSGALEAARIEAGLPVMGREITEKTIPQEAGIVDRTVSFTKGCYTGQELVARIDARGNRVPRRLVGFVADGDVGEGAEVVFQGGPVGRLTSVAFSPGFGQPVALGYLKRDVAVPATVTIAEADRRVGAEALTLPLDGARRGSPRGAPGTGR